MTRSSAITILVFLAAGTAASAQLPSSVDPPEDVTPATEQSWSLSAPVQLLPNAPRPATAPTPTQAYAGIVLGAFCGMGASTSSVATKPTGGCGAGMNLLMYAPFFFEIGVMAPQANRSYLTGYMSYDLKLPLRSVDKEYLPVVIAGYSRLFEIGHALDYGIALAIPRRGPKNDYGPRSYQFELRDYWTFANPNQHNVMLRIGWLVGGSD